MNPLSRVLKSREVQNPLRVSGFDVPWMGVLANFKTQIPCRFDWGVHPLTSSKLLSRTL